MALTKDRRATARLDGVSLLTNATRTVFGAAKVIPNSYRTKSAKFAVKFRLRFACTSLSERARSLVAEGEIDASSSFRRHGVVH